MRFLITLLWMVVAVVVAIFSYRNWSDVTLGLWGPLQADIKLPLLMAVMFLIGFIPIWLVMRARVWALKRKLMIAERPPVASPTPTAIPTMQDEPAAFE